MVQNMTKDIFIKTANHITHINFIRDYYMFLELPLFINGSLDINNFDTIKLSHVYFKYPFTEKDTLSDINISNIDISKYYNHISIVAQYFTKYNMKLKNNIIISDNNREQDTDRVVSILNDIELFEYASKDNIEKYLGKEFNGLELSGGEWQKLAIARSLYKKDTELFILDEPTSALDPIIENEILKKYLSIIKEKTAVIVSHRVGLCKYMDKILFLKNGRLDGIGTHEELLNNNPDYKFFYTEQQKWYV
jgi:ABC-type transport system involved in cytochrome bd biosynthesis fused ATPase/permease subunit